MSMSPAQLLKPDWEKFKLTVNELRSPVKKIDADADSPAAKVASSSSVLVHWAWPWLDKPNNATTKAAKQSRSVFISGVLPLKLDKNPTQALA